MILLDTDHLTILLDTRTTACAPLEDRLRSSPDADIQLPVISVEEQLRGWLAAIARHKDIDKQPPEYVRLVGVLRFLRRWEIVPFDAAAAREFKRLRREGVRIGSQDLKIASMALVHGAKVLSRNLRDFTTVPGLRVESWL